MKVYKIRDISTGLFCRGGYGFFDKNGKMWKQIGHVKAFLTRHRKVLNRRAGKETTFPVTWEIVEYELVERKIYNCNTLKEIEVANGG